MTRKGYGLDEFGGSPNSEVVPKKGKYCFRDKEVHILKSLVIPVNLHRRKVQLLTEVVEGDIPWLLGKNFKENGSHSLYRKGKYDII